MEEMMIPNEVTTNFIKLVESIETVNPLLRRSITEAKGKITSGVDTLEGVDELMDIINIHLTSFNF